MFISRLGTILEYAQPAASLLTEWERKQLELVRIILRDLGGSMSFDTNDALVEWAKITSDAQNLGL